MARLADLSYESPYYGLKFERDMNNFRFANQGLMKATDVLKSFGNTASSFAPFFLSTRGLGALFAPSPRKIGF